MKKFVLGSVLALAAVGALVLLISGPTSDGKVAKPKGGPVPVVVAAAYRGEFVTSVESVGTARANESVQITAQVTETVESVHFEDGDEAQAGQLLIQLRTAQELAELQEAEVNLAQQRREFRRLTNLAKTQAVSEFQVDEQESKLKAAEAQFAAAKARVEDRRITAPFSGKLGIRRVSPGSLVEPGDVVTTLDDIRVVKLDFSIPEPFLPTLLIGQTVVAKSPAFPGESFRGEVVGIDSRVDPVTRAVTVRAAVANPDARLRPGMLFTLRLIKDRTQSLIIPEAAVVPIGDKHYVFVVDAEGKAQRRELELGRRRVGEVEVESGLAQGDRVVVEGMLRVKPGAEVKVVRELERPAETPT